MSGFRITLGFLVLGCLPALGVRQDAQSRVKYPNGSGTWNNQLWMAEGPDGLNFGRPRHFTASAASPSLIKDAKGRLIAAFQWYPKDERNGYEQIGIRISTDDGKTWTETQAAQFKGHPSEHARPRNPTLALLDDGRIRLYYRGSAPTGGGSATWSAISRDAVNYEREPGIRFTVERETVVDCTVGRIGKMWHLYAPVLLKDGRGYHAESADGLQFKRLPDVQMTDGRAWFGSAVSLPRGIRFYGTGRNIWSAESLDGQNWELNYGDRAIGADPAVLKAADGRWLIVTSGPKDLIQSVIPDSPPPPPFP